MEKLDGKITNRIVPFFAASGVLSKTGWAFRAIGVDSSQLSKPVFAAVIYRNEEWFILSHLVHVSI